MPTHQGHRVRRDPPTPEPGADPHPPRAAIPGTTPTAGDGGERLATLMARLAEGDGVAVGLMAFEHRGPIAAALWRHLPGQGRHHLTEEELDILVLDVVLELVDCAAAWRPDGGALPWVWADARVRQVVASFLGTYAEPLDHHEPLLAEPASDAFTGPEDDLLAVLAAAADRHPALAHPGLGVVREALALVASPRDGALLLEVRAQQAGGDPSPAHTVGARFGMQPPAVRQAVRRVRQRLVRLSVEDDRFRSLAELPLVDPAA